jgi:hypothetical protein
MVYVVKEDEHQFHVEADLWNRTFRWHTHKRQEKTHIWPSYINDKKYFFMSE